MLILSDNLSDSFIENFFKNTQDIALNKTRHLIKIDIEKTID
jgi:hypothetical protein